jgi:uncharacterized protein YjgD (DUF1641 family)
MAHPITFKPAPVDPRKELMERVANAPLEHADALLTAWELLQTAHDQGILDLAKGLIGGKDIITGKLAEAANMPESVAGIRNLIAAGRLLSSVNPEMMQRLAQGMEAISAVDFKRRSARVIVSDAFADLVGACHERVRKLFLPGPVTRYTSDNYR